MAVSHDQIMAMLKRNANYNDALGSTTGAGYIGGCGCCGGGYIGGAYIGGCMNCMPMAGYGKPPKGVRHCITPLKLPSGKYRCKEWAEGPKPKSAKYKSMASLYKALNKKPTKPKTVKSKYTPAMLKALERFEMAEKVPKPKKLSAKLPKLTAAQLAMLPMPAQMKYRECIERKVGPSGKKRCTKYNILGKPPRNEGQVANQTRLGLLSKLYALIKKRDPMLTRKDVFNQAKEKGLTNQQIMEGIEYEMGRQPGVIEV